jgi:hypothetical protein
MTTFQNANVPQRLLLEMELFRQNDNALSPWNACNTTSMAMCAAYHGIVGNDSWPQLEDQFTEEMEAAGLSRFDMEAMTRFLNSYAEGRMRADFSNTHSVNKCIETLSRGVPIIVSGKFTPSWHFIVLTGYDIKAQKFAVHDPNGEYWRTGYDKRPNQGKEEYSFNLIDTMCNDDGYHNTIWAIEVSGVGNQYREVTAAQWAERMQADV